MVRTHGPWKPKEEEEEEEGEKDEEGEEEEGMISLAGFRQPHVLRAAPRERGGKHLP